MEIVLVIVGVIAIISLYDYFTTKNWQQVTSSTRNEVVFKNRNKDYGAFALRRDYDKTLLYVIGGVVGTIGLMSFTLMSGKEVVKNVIEPKLPPVYDTIPLIFEPKQKHAVEPVKHKKQDNGAQPDNPVEPLHFQFTNDSTDVKKLPVQDDSLGTQTPNPVKPGGGDPWGEPGPGGGGTGTGNPDPPVESVNIIHDDHEVDKDAKFNGSLQLYISNNFVVPQGDFDEMVEGTCYLKFVINQDGSISNVQVEKGVPYCTSCDKEALRVVKKMPNWIPAEIKGKPVRSYARLPIKISF